jgi:hypothetical protein
MKRLNPRPYKLNYLLLLRSFVILLLVSFALVKPIRTIVLDFSEDKIEYSCEDSEEQESDEEESKEKDVEEGDEMEDRFSIDYWHALSASSLKLFVNTEHHRSSEFHLGVVLPPPELV